MKVHPLFRFKNQSTFKFLCTIILQKLLIPKGTYLELDCPSAILGPPLSFVCMHVKLLQSCPTLWDLYVACQTPLSMGFSRQEYQSGLPFPPPGLPLPDPGIKPASLMPPALTGGFFTTEPPGKPLISYMTYIIHLSVSQFPVCKVGIIAVLIH